MPRAYRNCRSVSRHVQPQHAPLLHQPSSPAKPIQPLGAGWICWCFGVSKVFKWNCNTKCYFCWFCWSYLREVPLWESSKTWDFFSGPHYFNLPIRTVTAAKFCRGQPLALGAPNWALPGRASLRLGSSVGLVFAALGFLSLNSDAPLHARLPWPATTVFPIALSKTRTFDLKGNTMKDKQKNRYSAWSYHSTIIVLAIYLKYL